MMSDVMKAAGAMAMLSVGMAFSQSGPQYNAHFARNDLTYFDSGKPVSKRAKRRLRGKGHPQGDK
jgi:hypothetical protein